MGTERSRGLDKYSTTPDENKRIVELGVQLGGSCGGVSRGVGRGVNRGVIRGVLNVHVSCIQFLPSKQRSVRENTPPSIYRGQHREPVNPVLRFLFHRQTGGRGSVGQGPQPILTLMCALGPMVEGQS